MKYRKFGKLDWEVSVLGFGAMRLPVIDSVQENIDEPEAIRMIRRSIDAGVNYVDTAYPYHGGNSELVVGRALKDGYREKVKLATKLPSWFIQKPEDFDRYLDEQLTRLDTDHIDFYLFHAMNKNTWPKIRDLDALKWAEGAQSDGRIHYLGFSFHDTLAVFKEIVDAYDRWTFCQIQYNFMDIEYQAGTEGLKYAHDKGLAVVVMEPLRGGNLTKEPPDSVMDLWGTAEKKRTPAEWALQWVWDHEEVPMALSGMTTMQHVEENLVYADQSEQNTFGPEEIELVEKVREEYIKRSPIPCTACRYCMPCPNGVNIPQVLSLYNFGYMYDDHRQSRYLYRTLPPEQQGDKCIECNECEELCPQDFPISEWILKTHGWLGPKK